MENPSPTSNQRPSTGYVHPIAIGLGIAVVVTTIGYALLSGHGLSTRLFTINSTTTTQANAVSSDPSSKPSKPEIYLTRESIDLLLDALDQAIRRKDVDGVLRLIAPDATITIHMKQGAQQQIATLTREEYRKTLAMEFAFPSANDFARVSTTVSLASDERSAKVSFKSIETLRQAHREIKIEGEETLVLKIRDDKPVITSLEQVVPGDST
ncbi:MAG: hypothetical protein EWM72_01353 [Nitrospira sp.]|nr:MAG: hypothetical protein EWM72_01353 [Nitrospira sp.]